MTPDQARTKFSNLLKEVAETVSAAGFVCAPNETGFEMEGADIEDNDKVNIYRSFTAFWLLKIIKQQGVATKSDIDKRVLLCLSIIGMNGNEETDKIIQTLLK